MCRRKRKESDRKKSVFGLGTKIFIGFIAAFVLYWFISAIDAAIRIKEAGGLIEEKSFIGILMYILDIAFPKSMRQGEQWKKRKRQRKPLRSRKSLSSLYNTNNSDEVPERTGSQRRIGPL